MVTWALWGGWGRWGKMGHVRKAAVAGAWYPGTRDQLAAEVDRYLTLAVPAWEGDITALIAPHAGLRYSGPVAAHAYKLVGGRRYEVAVLVGPSHHVGFDGVAICLRGVFETPLGAVPIAESCADAIARASECPEHPTAHTREHSREAVALPRGVSLYSNRPARVAIRLARPLGSALDSRPHCRTAALLVDSTACRTTTTRRSRKADGA